MTKDSNPVFDLFKRIVFSELFSLNLNESENADNNYYVRFETVIDFKANSRLEAAEGDGNEC